MKDEDFEAEYARLLEENKQLKKVNKSLDQKLGTANINEIFEGVLVEIPSNTTINNWIKKYGLDVYKSSGEAHKGKGYAEVVDESMMIGSEKLLVTLGIPSKHLRRPLRHADVSMLGMAVSDSWTGEKVKDQLETAAQKVGHLPEYVISDNTSIMNRGIRSGIYPNIAISAIPWACIWKEPTGMRLILRHMSKRWQV